MASTLYCRLTISHRHSADGATENEWFDVVDGTTRKQKLARNVIGGSNKYHVGPLDFCGVARIVAAQGSGRPQCVTKNYPWHSTPDCTLLEYMYAKRILVSENTIGRNEQPHFSQRVHPRSLTKPETLVLAQGHEKILCRMLMLFPTSARSKMNLYTQSLRRSGEKK